MKNNLSVYLEKIDSALKQQDIKKVRYCGETALRKLSELSFSLLEEFTLYCYLGRAYYVEKEYSRSLDVFYKASMFAFKHSLKPVCSAYTFVMLGNNLMSLRNINSAIEQFRKAEQYFQKYGTGTQPMNKNEYYTVITGLAYCYLYKNQLKEVRDIIDTKLLNYEDGVAANIFFPINYFHLKGEYEIALKNNDKARQAFNECVRFSHDLDLPLAAVEAKIHIAFIDLLEKKNESAEDILKSVIKDARKIHLNEQIGEASLLLSKCYTLMNMPDKAVAVESRVKPILNKIDMGWLYERSREYEHLYNRLQSEGRNDGHTAPEVLADTINGRHERAGYKNVIIGKSLVMLDIYHLIEKIASTDLPILIQGETGTGKELIASALHQNSLRRNENWLAFNCGALTESLVESELFGHTKGAFTGAVEVKKGYVELASNGTLFMDEIADMSLKIQQKLLRVLEEKQVWRIGAESPAQINTRFIFASNQNIEELVRKKMFREDLYYRINAIMINLPALRERKEDIELLLKYFLAKYTSTGRTMEITREALITAVNYSWPGNIREMKNEIRRICALNKESVLLETPMFSPIITAYRPQEAVQTSDQASFKDLKDAFEKKVLTETLRKCNGNIVQAARTLKYNRSALYRKLRLLGIITQE